MGRVSHLRVLYSLAAAVLAALLLVAGVPADAAPSVSLTLSGVIVERDATGATHDVPLGARPALPGDVLRYTIRATNTGRESVRALAPVGRIPNGTAYAGAAAPPAARAQFSLDGKTFSEHPTVLVTGPHGVERRAADPSQYVAVRWTGIDALRPGASAAFDYLVRVR